MSDPSTGPARPALDAGPPARAEWVLGALVADAALREPLLGDLAEEFEGRRARDGAAAARRWYRAQALRSVAPLVAASWWPGPAARPRRLAALLPGVAVGYVTILVLHQLLQVAAGALLGSAGVAPGTASAGPALAACSIAAGAVAGVLGGAVAARSLPDAPLAGALALAAASWALAVAGVVGNGGMMPLWYWGGVQLVGFPLGACAGGLLRARGRPARQSPDDGREATPN